MPNNLVAALLEGMRQTTPFRTLPMTNRPTEELWSAHNAVLLQLQMPLHHERLRKPRPKDKAFDTAIQSGLAELCSFAAVAGTNQAVVRIEGGAPRAISFQSRPFGVNWTPARCITPAELRNDFKDPLLDTDAINGRSTLTMPVTVRDVVFLAGQVALALARQVEGLRANGVATFIFNARGEVPGGRVVYRPRHAGVRGLSARTVELAG